jgi:hypothetical protein
MVQTTTAGYHFDLSLAKDARAAGSLTFYTSGREFVDFMDTAVTIRNPAGSLRLQRRGGVWSFHFS